MYEIAIFDTPKDMYRSYEVAKLLNPKMTEEDYISVIDRITKVSNYKQHVILHKGDVVSLIATQDILVMGAAPNLTRKLDNVATLPEHRGFATRELMRRVVSQTKEEGYSNICLNCNKQNDRGNNFYQRMGFKQTGNGWELLLG
jgi:GNAT superfamily N-acetyltransferase